MVKIEIKSKCKKMSRETDIVNSTLDNILTDMTYASIAALFSTGKVFELDTDFMKTTLLECFGAYVEGVQAAVCSGVFEEAEKEAKRDMKKKYKKSRK